MYLLTTLAMQVPVSSLMKRVSSVSSKAYGKVKDYSAHEAEEALEKCAPTRLAHKPGAKGALRGVGYHGATSGTMQGLRL